MKIIETTATFSFTEFDYVKSHLSGFEKSKLGVLKSLLPIEELINFFRPKSREINIENELADINCTKS